MQTELVISVITMTFAFGALIAGVFGMNLKSGREQQEGWFFAVCYVGLGAMGFVLLVTAILFRQMQVFR